MVAGETQSCSLISTFDIVSSVFPHEKRKHMVQLNRRRNAMYITKQLSGGFVFVHTKFINSFRQTFDFDFPLICSSDFLQRVSLFTFLEKLKPDTEVFCPLLHLKNKIWTRYSNKEKTAATIIKGLKVYLLTFSGACNGYKWTLIWDWAQTTDLMCFRF